MTAWEIDFIARQSLSSEQISDEVLSVLRDYANQSRTGQVGYEGRTRHEQAQNLAGERVLVLETLRTDRNARFTAN